LEGELETAAGAVAIAVAGLGGEEDIVAVCLQPGREAQLGLAVGSSGVDVVDPGGEGDVEQGGGLLHRHRPKSGRAEDHAAAVVAAAAEGGAGDRTHASAVSPAAALPSANWALTTAMSYARSSRGPGPHWLRGWFTKSPP